MCIRDRGEGGKYHEKENEHPLPDSELLTFALAGNQNCGKTTLFNQLTGCLLYTSYRIGDFIDGHAFVTHDTCIDGKKSLSKRCVERIYQSYFAAGCVLA